MFTMSNHGVQGYQVMFVLKDALERAASTDREKVREAIREALSGFDSKQKVHP